MINKATFIIVFLSPVFFGCVPLTQVHNYATSSVEALNKIDEVNYSFKDYCLQDCELQQLRVGEIRPAFSCACKETAAKADDAVTKIHSTITAYLVAVAALSNNSGFSYDVSGLTEAVQKNPLLRLSDQQVSVATKAGNFLTTAATTFYRKKKLREYLVQADTIFRDLTETFIYLVDDRLRAQLKFEYDARIPNIKQMLDNTNDKALKQMVVKLYLDEKAYYDKHNALIDTYVELLKRVQKGYHELYVHRYNLRDVATKDILSRYTKEIRYLTATLK